MPLNPTHKNPKPKELFGPKNEPRSIGNLGEKEHGKIWCKSEKNNGKGQRRGGLYLMGVGTTEHRLRPGKESYDGVNLQKPAVL